MRRFISRLLSFFRSGRADAELTREIDSHLQLLADRYVAQGMSPDDARYAARRAFGGQIEQTKARHRDSRGFRLLEESWLDLKLGARMAIKHPGLTAIAVFALAVAIGSGAAYLEFTNDLLHPRLPGADGDRIVAVTLRDITANRRENRALHDLQLWRGRVTTIEGLGAAAPLERNLITSDGHAEPVTGVEISASAFSLFPMPPLLGRPLIAEDERAGAPPVVVIGERLWKSRLGADPAIVGRTVMLGSTPHTIVGVMPARFGFPINHSLWVPLRLEGPAAQVARGEGPPIRIFGRLAPAVALEAAQAELAGIADRVTPSGSDRQLRPEVRRYAESLWPDDAEGQLQRMVLYSVNVFFIALLGVCGANVATLVFGRTIMRESEITVRTALGASRARIVGQLFAEALVLSVLAMAVGLAAAWFVLQWGRSTFLTAAADGAAMPFWWDDRFAPATLIYAGVLAALAAVVVGMVPALKATGGRMASGLKHAAAGASGLRFGGVWTAIIVGQVALTVLFLSAMVTLGWEFTTSEYRGGEVAFAREQFVVAQVEADDPGRTAAVQQELERRLLAEPGVVGVSFGTAFPGQPHGEFIMELADVDVPMPTHGVLWSRSAGVAADYFDVFDAPIVAGRRFSEADVALDRPVAVVDETFVREVLGGRNPIGQRVRQLHARADGPPSPTATSRWYEIVGVVQDLSTRTDETSEDAVIYLPGSAAAATPMQMIVRFAGSTDAAGARIRRIAAELDAALRVSDILRLDQVNEADRIAMSFWLPAFGVVSAVTLLLATAGIYALLAFAVARRTREIGIRIAVGATPRGILRDLFGRTFTQVGIGVAAGSVPGALLVMVGAPEVQSGAGTLVAAVAVTIIGTFLLSVAMLACVAPARRALRVQPTEALRAE